MIVYGAAILALAFVGLLTALWKVHEGCALVYRKWERRVQRKALDGIAGAESDWEREAARPGWENPRLLYHCDGGDPSIPVDPGRERLAAAFRAGEEAHGLNPAVDDFDLVAVGRMKPAPEGRPLAPVHDPDAGEDSPDRLDEWAMCGWSRHHVMVRDCDFASGKWIVDPTVLAAYDTGAEALAFIRGFSNARRRLGGGLPMSAHMDLKSGRKSA